MTPRGERPRAVVTGGAGFVGSHLVDRLIADGTEVLVVDDLSTGSLASLPESARFERRDIATEGLARLFGSWRPGIVYHLAAQASVPASIRDPQRDLAVNVIGTHRVADAARRSGASRLVFVSSGGAVYGETRRAASEGRCPAPTSYYGIHKLAAEGHVALSGVSYQIARPANIYGPRQAAGLEGAVVAAFLDQAHTNRHLIIHGDGLQTRDLVHVTDIVDGLARLGATTAPSRVWNIASGASITILELGELIEAAIGHRLDVTRGPRRPGDVRHSRIDAARLSSIGWNTTISLADGIRGLVPLDGALRPLRGSL